MSLCRMSLKITRPTVVATSPLALRGCSSTRVLSLSNLTSVMKRFSIGSRTWMRAWTPSFFCAKAWKTSAVLANVRPSPGSPDSPISPRVAVR